MPQLALEIPGFFRTFLVQSFNFEPGHVQHVLEYLYINLSWPSERHVQTLKPALMLTNNGHA